MDVTSASRPFEILDNSFLVEEAFNQEAGIFQNIVVFQRAKEHWDLGFTQEWPVVSQAHQFSYMLPLTGGFGERGVGDIQINYRYQALMEGGSRPALSPRVTLMLPTGDESRGFGSGEPAIQINVPVSKQFDNLYLHVNGGLTYLRARNGSANGEKVGLTTPHAGVSAIWRLKPMLNLMVEQVLEWPREVAFGLKTRSTVYTFSPGFRGGWNVGDQQIIVGAAMPVERAGGHTETSLLAYLSYELPFSR